MIWFDDCIIWSLNNKSILDLLMQHQYDIKIDVNAKYANQKKTEMKRITAKLKTVYVKKLKVWHKQNVNMRETNQVIFRFINHLTEYILKSVINQTNLELDS